jgi:hypothetical protein
MAHERGEVMPLPRKTDSSVRYARLATRGVLSRLALMFSANGKKQFTGDEVAHVLLQTVQGIGGPDETLVDRVCALVDQLSVEVLG